MAVSCSAYFCKAAAPPLFSSRSAASHRRGASQGLPTFLAKSAIQKGCRRKAIQLSLKGHWAVTAGKGKENFLSRDNRSVTRGANKDSRVAVACTRQIQADAGPASDPGGSPVLEGSEGVQSLNSSSSMAFLGLAIGLSLVVGNILAEPAHASTWDHQHVSLDKDMQALAFNFDPLYEEFWDNVRRFILYFFSVTTGGIYMIVKPVGDLFKKPLTAALTVVILGGSFFLVFTVLQLMLGLTEA